MHCQGVQLFGILQIEGGEAVKRIKDWEELTIQDNFLFQKVMRNKRLCQYLIEKILQIKIADITYPDTEKAIDIRLDSKSVRLDVYVQDDTGRVFNIEMQCTDEQDSGLAKRTRYYQAMIDMDMLKKGEVYNKLRPSYIIFICTFDAFDAGLPMYTFRNRCIETEGLELGDEGTKIFLNSKGDSDTLDPDVRAFLRYVDGKAAEGAFVKAVEREVIGNGIRETKTIWPGRGPGRRQRRRTVADDIGDAERWGCERNHSKICKSFSRIYYRTRQEESSVIVV